MVTMATSYYDWNHTLYLTDICWLLFVHLYRFYQTVWGILEFWPSWENIEIRCPNCGIFCIIFCLEGDIFSKLKYIRSPLQSGGVWLVHTNRHKHVSETREGQLGCRGTHHCIASHNLVTTNVIHCHQFFQLNHLHMHENENKVVK